MIKDDKYLQLLKFGRDNLDGIKSKDLEDKMMSLGLPCKYDGMVNTLNSFTRDLFFRDGDKFILTFPAYFQLMEHERLEEARIDSKKAITIAKWSIWLTILFIVASSIIGILQYLKLP